MKRITKCFVSLGTAVTCLTSVMPVNAKIIPYKKPDGFDFAFDESIKDAYGRNPYTKNYYSKKQYQTLSKAKSYDPQYKVNGGYTAKLNKWMSLKAGKASIRYNYYKLNVTKPSILTVQIANPQPKAWLTGGSCEFFYLIPMKYPGVFVDAAKWAGGITGRFNGYFIDDNPAKAAKKVKSTYTKGLAYVKGPVILFLDSVTPDVLVRMKISAYPLSHNTKLKLGKKYTKAGKKAHFGIYKVKIPKDSHLTIKHSSKKRKTHFFMWNSKYKSYNPMRSDIEDTIQNEPQAYIGKKTKFKVRAGTYYFVAETIKDDKYSFRMTAKPLKSTKVKRRKVTRKYYRHYRRRKSNKR